MIKPKYLKAGDTIGVIAPSSQVTEGKQQLVYNKLTQMGFKVKMGKSCYENYGYLSGTDEVRAKDLNDMFLDKEVDGIICIRGGYGTPRILELLDYEGIKNNPKVFMGYSDITALHIAMNQLCNLVTFHGPMAASDMIGDFSDFSKESMFKAIGKTEAMGLLDNPKGEEIETLNGGVAEGEIIGGNLSLIVATIGSPYEIDTKGKIFFIEEVGEQPYRIDRMLTQLKLAGKFDDATGIVLGDWNDCDCPAQTGEYEDSLTLRQVFEDIVVPAGKPTIFNLKSGHCEPKITIPFGVKARLDADKKELCILESATK